MFLINIMVVCSKRWEYSLPSCFGAFFLIKKLYARVRIELTTSRPVLSRFHFMATIFPSLKGHKSVIPLNYMYVKNWKYGAYRVRKTLQVTSSIKFSISRKRYFCRHHTYIHKILKIQIRKTTRLNT